VSNAFIFKEAWVAEVLALPRSELRSHRNTHLEENVDWKKDGGEIKLSERGLERVLAWNGLPLTDEFLEKLKEKSDATEPGQKKLTVVVAIPPNSRMVLANESGDPNEDRELVDVGNNTNLAIGDVLEVGEHEVQHGMFQLLSKLPTTSRRPETNESLRDPGADWGRVEAEQIRQQGIKHRREMAAKKK
jgi:hypothetical protein